MSDARVPRRRLPGLWCLAVVLVGVLAGIGALVWRKNAKARAANGSQSPRTWSCTHPTPAPGEPREIHSLIEQLASTNAPPNRPFGPLPDGYDEKAQELVEEAQTKLLAKGTAAFPLLIAHQEDARYCGTYPTSILRDFTVGEICLQIIERQIDLRLGSYKGRTGADGESHGPPDYLQEHRPLDRWWAKRSHLSLRDIQIEVMEWTITQEREIGFPDAKSKKDWLDPLVAKLAELRSEEPPK